MIPSIVYVTVEVFKDASLLDAGHFVSQYSCVYCGIKFWLDSLIIDC